MTLYLGMTEKYAVAMNSAKTEILVGVFDTLDEATQFCHKYSLRKIIPIFSVDCDIRGLIESPNIATTSQILDGLPVTR